MKRSGFWPFLLAAAILGCLVLRLYRHTEAAPPRAQQPFANAVEQRMEMIRELGTIRQLLKEQNNLVRQQNELLRSILARLPAGEQKK